jgi:hypothetical protein
MKTLTQNLKAELTGSDLLAALVSMTDPQELLAEIMQTPGVLASYLKKNRAQVTKAVTGYLKKEHALNTDKVIYTQTGAVLVEASTAGRTLPAAPARSRVAPSGHKKRNKGIFDFLREYLDDERGKGTREIDLNTLLNDVRFFFPKMNKRYLSIYLHDKRQLKGVDFSSDRGTVILK